MSPKICILTIGNELLEGRITDKNGAFACQKLYQQGYLVQQKRSILDDPKTITDTLKKLLKLHDVVITSGGLGPTLDDLTLPTVCKFLKTKLVFSDHLFKKLQKKSPHTHPEHLKYAAYIPEKGKVFNSHVGIVPGYLFQIEKKQLILLPGVPHEFRHLINEEVLKTISKQYPIHVQEYKKIAHLCRVPESEIAPYLMDLKTKHPEIDFGVYPHLGLLSIHIKAKANTSKQALLKINPIYKLIEKRYKKSFYPHRFPSIIEAIEHLLLQKKWTLSVAESCTGGMLSSLFTQKSGASRFFKSSIVAYDNDIKEKCLNVSKYILSKKGAVSTQCAESMALGCNQLFSTDIAIATTGIAGPTGGSEKKPNGTVYIAIAYQNKIIFCEKFLFKGDRNTVQERACLYALAELWMIRDNI